MKIYKYQVGFYGFGGSSVYMPTDAKIIKIDMQNGYITFWAETERSADKTYWNFFIVPTGGDVHGKHLATIFENDLVLHIYGDNYGNW